MLLVVPPLRVRCTFIVYDALLFYLLMLLMLLLVPPLRVHYSDQVMPAYVACVAYVAYVAYSPPLRVHYSDKVSDNWHINFVTEPTIPSVWLCQ